VSCVGHKDDDEAQADPTDFFLFCTPPYRSGSFKMMSLLNIICLLALLNPTLNSSMTQCKFYTE